MKINTLYTRTCLTLIAFIMLFTLAAQPAAVEWLKKNNTSRNIHTLTVLQANAEGFFLLREKSEPGKATIPYLTCLDPTGGEIYDQPLPGFETNPSVVFRFAIKGEGNMLVYYEQKGPDNSFRSCIRYFNYRKKEWTGPEKDIFSPFSTSFQANSKTGFRVSTDGQKVCLYRLIVENTSQSVHIAMFDKELNLLWQKVSTLPKQEGATIVQQFFCSNSGQLCLHARQYSAGARLSIVNQEQISPLFWPDGRPMYQNDNTTSGDAPTCTNALFMIGEKDKEPNVFFLEAITKYTHSFELGEDNSGQIIGVGLGSDDRPDRVEKYFIYQIEPSVAKGEMLKTSNIPASFRKAFMSESAAEQKKPAEDVSLRWIKCTPDNKIWFLAEQEKINTGTGMIESAALVRLDSTYRIAGVTPVEKFNKVNQGDRRSFASIAPCMTDKNNWWLLWHQTNWPEMQLMLTPTKGKESFYLTNASRSGVAMLINTITPSNDTWYFVGESEDGKAYRIGFLTPVKKNSKK